ncbi:MAG: hypothetical protein ACK4NP_09865 [Parvularculaceae bacterium]
MLRRLTLVSTAALAVGCAKSSDDKSPSGEGAPGASAEQAPEIEPYRKLIDRNAQHPELDPTQKIGGWEGRSPFEGDRVIGLNAIVKRTLDVSREYDRSITGIRAAADKAAAADATADDRAAAEDGLKKVEAWHGEAKAAFDDMKRAEADLLASGEYYDPGIFAGMVKFVTDIEAELREETAALAAKLGR